ncbi:MAG TPA: peptidylprolyl isomerase [Candidatus Polarisedimenticolia bacterium]|nr:peptidylprolyl isomerase [Candidatus Polarisedimenticolia bacterium]
MKNLLSSRLLALTGGALLLAAPAVSRAQSKGAVVEEIIARVNNRIVTLSEYQKASRALPQEVEQDCPNCPPDKIQEMLKKRETNLLRDMIDQQLLIERAKDMDISVETDLIKRLDEVRKQNNLPSMEALQKAVEAQGIAWEDYRSQLRDSLMTQEVIRREVGGRMDITNDEVKQYYDAHQQAFVRPEEVALAEIFLSTEGKTPEEMAAVRARAEDLRNRVEKGEDFAELARRFSGGSTAKDGGDLGVFERGQLAKLLEDAVFSLEKGQITDVIQTKTGFEILKVVNHYHAGLQPLDKVENEIMNHLYQQKMEPAMRNYLAQLREESYVKVKPGYTDTAAVPGATVIQEVAPTPDTPGKKKGKKLPLPKVGGS